MAFSPVSWLYRDIFTSAKAAQMEENLRTHDHYSAGQGAFLGLKATASGRTVVAVGGLAANTRASFVIPFPAGRFEAPPGFVYAGPELPNNARLSNPRAVTATEFTVDVWTGTSPSGAAGIPIQWLAVAGEAGG